MINSEFAHCTPRNQICHKTPLLASLDSQLSFDFWESSSKPGGTP
jgi:hypothetical protein